MPALELIANQSLLPLGRGRLPWSKIAAATGAVVVGLCIWIIVDSLLTPLLALGLNYTGKLSKGLQYLLTAPSFLLGAMIWYLRMARRTACPFCSKAFALHKTREETTCSFHEWKVDEQRAGTLRLYETKERWQPYKCGSCGMTCSPETPPILG
ncbi:MAG: hypothetical protein EBV30_08665 [Actinobacteria bacterium]|nr:hypothetical protein [Actinomycetota bacterium]